MSSPSDPAFYRPTCEGWDEYKRQLPRVLSHLALKHRASTSTTLDWSAWLKEMPWPELDPQHPMRGAFLIDDQWFYIPCKFRLQHNEPIYYETKKHYWVEVRSEHPGLPGRSTSTFKARLEKKRGGGDPLFEMFMPYIKVPLKLEEFTRERFKQLGRDESYILNEFLPHITVSWGWR